MKLRQFVIFLIIQAIAISAHAEVNNSIAIIYLNKYCDDYRFIPSYSEITAYAHEQAEQFGDDVLEVNCTLVTDHTDIAWEVQIIEYESSSDVVYQSTANVQVYMNELCPSHPFDKELFNYDIIFDSLEEYHQYVTQKNQFTKYLVEWTELYGPFFSWDVFRKNEFYKKYHHTAYETINDWNIPNEDGYWPEWMLPSDDRNIVETLLHNEVSKARNLVMQHYNLSQHNLDHFIEDARYLGNNRWEFRYWLKAYLDNEYYWIPLCKVIPVIVDLDKEKTELRVYGIGKELLSYISN